MGAVARYLAAQDGLSDFVGRVICWATLPMIGVLIIEIVARYFLNSPTVWAHESSTMLYGGFSILAGCYTLRHGGHVRSEVIWGLLPGRGRAFCDTLTYGLGVIALAVFFKLSVEFAAESWERLEYSHKSIWQPPVYPIKTVIPVAVGLLMLQNIAELLRAVLTLAGINHSRESAGDSAIDLEMPIAAARSAVIVKRSDDR